MTQEREARDVPLPEYVQIEPVGQCNLRCRMCAIQFRRDGPPHGPPAFMDFDVFVRIVGEMTRLKRLHLQGLGEPFMHPRFFDMVRHASDRGIRVTSNSNMTLLGDRRAEQCLNSGLAELHVSIDGATAATYESIRVRARYARVRRNLAHLTALQRQRGLSRPRIVIVFVLMRRNFEELPGLVRQAAGWGIGEVFVQHLCHDFGESSLPGHYAPMRDFVDRETIAGVESASVDAAFEEARTEAGRLGVELRLPRTRRKATPGCDWPWTGAYFSYEGLAMPCCMIGTPDRLNFGNAGVHGAASLWRGADYRAFRERLASDDPPDICRSCALYHGTF